MRRIVAATGTFLLAGTAAAILSAGTASAATTPAMPILLGSLQLTKTDSAGVTTTADLTCVRGRDVHGQTYTAGTGTVTDPTAACLELADVDGDLDALDVHPTWLTSALYAPVSVTATGSWNGAAVDWSASYGNGSVLAKFTGDVFGF